MERPTTITARRGALTLDWDDLRFFLAISRLGSLSAAATDLHVAQSTVGRRLASLEASLGVPLWCTNKPMPLRLRHLACYATRIVTGIPRHVIRLTTLHAIFASVR